MAESKNIQTEVDAAYLYQVLADNENDTAVKTIFLQMAEIERQHAQTFADASGLSLPKPSGRARVLHTIGRLMGYDYVLGVLLDTEKSVSHALQKARRGKGMEAQAADTNHVRILRNILDNQTQVTGPGMARFEKRHRSVGGNALRAAVLGGNDGLVSNFSLVMGVAGAAENNQIIVLTGIAGLLAGALSMALGEWISVKSSQELYENQMQLEMEELEVNPAGEEKEIALIYMSKGIPEAQARSMAAELMKDKNQAHTLLVQEELGIKPEELKGSAWEAAISSFVLFAVGAILPVIPFLLSSGYSAIIASAVLSGAGLFLIGAAITLFTGKSVWYSGFRQVVFGLLAAAITFGIGKLIGVSVG
ncbi:MAG: VIT1/CCC1 transporter family protein [Bacteroidetes bacterium]|nr:VIT1/CCC1 transporter family protein [Bacteroidota bacterium]